MSREGQGELRAGIYLKIIQQIQHGLFIGFNMLYATL